MPDISVIVPIHNTEKYLKRCLDSVLAQTYQDYELILVDNGSTDASPLLCDRYAESDDRIAVIHQKDRGPGGSKNAGLDAVTDSDSQWVIFVDSDDWVSPFYLEWLRNAALRTDTKVSVCEYDEVYSEAEAGKPGVSDAVLMSAESLYCERNITSVTPWGKLYAKELWRNFRFPEGKMNEDEFVIYKVLFAAGKLAYLSSPLYYFYANPESLTRRKWTPARLAGLEAKKEQMQYMKDNGFQKAFRQAVLNYGEVASFHIPMIDKKEYPDEIIRLRKLLRRHIDVEYEWYLRKAKEKIQIPGKFVNEVTGGRDFSECDDPAYKKQIICVIE